MPARISFALSRNSKNEPHRMKSSKKFAVRRKPSWRHSLSLQKSRRLPADKIPFPGNGVQLAKHIVAEHYKDIEKAAKAGKKKRKIEDSTLIKAEVPRYCHEDGTLFDYENVRSAYFRNLSRTRRGY